MGDAEEGEAMTVMRLRVNVFRGSVSNDRDFPEVAETWSDTSGHVKP
jgi:hypothetical protein